VLLYWEQRLYYLPVYRLSVRPMPKMVAVAVAVAVVVAVTVVEVVTEVVTEGEMVAGRAQALAATGEKATAWALAASTPAGRRATMV